MEFLLTEEQRKKVEKLLPKIAKKHGLQCSLVETRKGGKGKEKESKAKAPKERTPPAKQGLKRKSEPPAKEGLKGEAEPTQSPPKSRRSESSPELDYMNVFPTPNPRSPVYPASVQEKNCLDGLAQKLYELAPEEVEKVIQIYSPVIIDEGDSCRIDLDKMTRHQRRALLQMLEDRLWDQQRLVTWRSSMFKFQKTFFNPFELLCLRR